MTPAAPGDLAPAALRMLLAPNPSPMTLDGTRTFVVGRSRPVVIDPGPDDASHLARVVDALDGATPAAILLTHHHPDHAAAAPALARHTGAPVWMAAGAIDIGFEPVRADRWIADGDAVETDAGSIRARATPGHAPEHMAFFWEGHAAPERGALFVGDLVMGVGDTTLIAPPEGDLGAYFASLRRVEQLGPGVLLPSHGPPLDEPRAAIGRYVRHRRERIAQVLAALRDAGPQRPAELVDGVYGAALDPRLRGAAEASLLAILQHLEQFRHVRSESDGRYAAIGPAPARET